jgi:chromosome partitioning protein
MLARDAAVAQRSGGAAELFSEATPTPAATAAGVDLLHGHQRLDEVDQRVGLSEAAGIRQRLLELPYDLVIVDTPPALGLRHLGPQVWADLVVTPLEPNSFSLLALGQTLAAIEEIRTLRPALQNRILINRFNKSSGQQNHYIAALAEHVELATPYLTLRVAVSDALGARPASGTSRNRCRRIVVGPWTASLRSTRSRFCCARRFSPASFPPGRPCAKASWHR